MKKLITLTLLIALLSCNETSKKEVPKEGDSFIVATYIDTSGQKILDIVGRKISKVLKYDTIKNIDIILVDTQYFKPVYLPAKDSSGKTILDTLTGKPRLFKNYSQISKDSVNWRVQNKDIKELTK